MKCDNDRSVSAYEKAMIMEAIIQFSEKFDGKRAYEISVQDVVEFTHDFVESKNLQKTYQVLNSTYCTECCERFENT